MRRPGSHGRLSIDQGRQRLEIDIDHRRGVGRRRFAHSDHSRHRLAGIEHAIDGQGPVGPGGARCQVRASENADDPGCGSRRAGVDALDAGGGERADDHLDVHEARDFEIGRVPRGPGDLLAALEPGAPLPDDTHQSMMAEPDIKNR